MVWNSYTVRKQERTKAYRKNLPPKGYRKWAGKCVSCSGSGYYDHNGSPPCGACGGRGRDSSSRHLVKVVGISKKYSLTILVSDYGHVELKVYKKGNPHPVDYISKHYREMSWGYRDYSNFKESNELKSLVESLVRAYALR